MLLDVTQWALTIYLYILKEAMLLKVSAKTVMQSAVAVGVHIPKVNVCQHKCINLPNHAVISEATDCLPTNLSLFVFVF